MEWMKVPWNPFVQILGNESLPGGSYGALALVLGIALGIEKVFVPLLLESA